MIAGYIDHRHLRPEIFRRPAQAFRMVVDVAREHDVPVHQDAGLVEALAKLEVGQTLPRELYAVVAEVLAFVYSVDAEAAR